MMCIIPSIPIYIYDNKWQQCVSGPACEVCLIFMIGRQGMSAAMRASDSTSLKLEFMEGEQARI